MSTRKTTEIYTKHNNSIDENDEVNLNEILPESEQITPGTDNFKEEENAADENDNDHDEALSDSEEPENTLFGSKNKIKITHDQIWELHTSKNPHLNAATIYDYINRKHDGFSATLKSIKQAISKCPQCVGYPKQIVDPEPGFTSIPVSLYPGHILFIDSGKIFKRCQHGFEHIFSIVDNYSGHQWTKPIKNLKASTIIGIIKEYVSNFGIPNTIQVDPHRSNLSNKLEKYCKYNNINLKCTEKFVHKSNQNVEESFKGSHSTAKRIVSYQTDCYKQAEILVQECWHEIVQFRVSSLRNCSPKHYSTDDKSIEFWATPAEIFFNGRNLNMIVAPMFMREQFRPFHEIKISFDAIFQTRRREHQARIKNYNKMPTNVLKVSDYVIPLINRSSKNQRHLSFNHAMLVTAIDGGSVTCMSLNEKLPPLERISNWHRDMLKPVSPETLNQIDNTEPGQIGASVNSKFLNREFDKQPKFD